MDVADIRAAVERLKQGRPAFSEGTLKISVDETEDGWCVVIDEVETGKRVAILHPRTFVDAVIEELNKG